MQGSSISNQGLLEEIAALKIKIQQLERSEMRQREIEERYRNLFDRTCDGISIMTVEGKLRDVNGAFARMHGYSVEETLRIGMEGLYSPQTFQRLPDMLQRLLAGESLVFEAEHAHRDGHVFPVEVSASLIASGGVQYIQCFHRDIAERRRAEESLGEREARLRGIIENTTAGYFYIDDKGLFQDVNDAWLKMHGYDSPDEVIGRHFALTQGENDLEAAKKNVETLLSGNAITTQQFSRRCKDGSVGCHIFSAHPVRQAGKIIGLEGFLIDTTAHNRFERELVESQSLIKAIVDSTSDMIWSVDSESFGLLSFNIGLSRYFQNEWGIRVQTGMHPEDLFPTEDFVKVWRGFYQRALDEGSYTTEYLVYSGTRTLLLVFNPIHLHGKVSGISVFGKDITGRKQAEDALRESEKRYRSLFENSVMGISEATPDGRLIAANTAYARMFGYANAEEMMQKVSDVRQIYADPGTRAEVLCILDRQGVMEPREVDVLRRDGTRFTVLVGAREVRDFNGNLQYYQAEQIDITERKRVEEETRELLAMLEALPCGIIIHDAAGTFLYANQRTFDMHGYSRDEFMSLRLSDVMAPESNRGIGPKMQEVEEHGETSLEVEHVRKDGKILPLWVNVKKTTWGGKGVFLSVETDITAQRRAEDNYQSLFRQMLDGFALHEIICDREGNPVDYRFINVNPAFERMTGLHSEDIVGRTVLEVLPETEPYWIETYGKVALTGEPVFFENLSAELKKHFAVTAFRPAPGQFACIFVDITDRKTAEAEKEKLQGQLLQSQKMESIGRLAGGVAHDFNNMLGVIIGHAEIAMEQANPTHPLYNDLLGIRKAAERSAALTQQLLAFARKQTIAPKVLDLNETVEGMLKMLRRIIGEDIDLVWLPGSGPAPVNIDPSQLDQVLANLCVNARDAIAGVGRVAIETDTVILDAEYCANSPGLAPGDYVLLAVSDNGCGMDRETQDKLFEPFFTTKDAGKGTGLGLAMIYGIIKQNHGVINVYSEKGHGTTFKIYLPRRRGNTEPLQQADAIATAARGKETILVVEDEPGMRDVIVRILRHQGYGVIVAATPAEAINIAEEYDGEIDLLMTDVVMPGMNGRELANHLLSLYPKLKRLFMSGYTANVIAHHGVLDEGVHFIQKPFNIKGVAVKIREVLDQK